MTARAKKGDVAEVRSEAGFVYVHFLGKHPLYGDCVAVASSVSASPRKLDSTLFADSFVAFYPFSAALSRGMVRVIGSLPSPELPGRLRRAGIRSRGKVETWIVQDDNKVETVRRTLSAEERMLPIAAIWNHEFLLKRVREGWRPEREA